MSNVFIIHGSYGSPESNWFPWLQSSLEKLGHIVHIPKFPTPDGQNLGAWRETFQPYQQYIDSEAIFVAHSVGPAFVCSLLEDFTTPVKACFFAAPFLGLVDNIEYDPINETFTCRDFDWERVQRGSQQFFVYGSDHDPYVPTKNSDDFIQKLGVEPVIIPGGGHLNIETGYDTFPLLLKDISRTLSDE